MAEFGFTALHACLEDNRRLIAAGKVQRWEVFKWAVAVIIALTTAAVAGVGIGAGSL